MGVSSFISAPSGSFSVTGVRTGLLRGDSGLRVDLLKGGTIDEVLVIEIVKNVRYVDAMIACLPGVGW